MSTFTNVVVSELVPTAHITVDRDRLKIYNGNNPLPSKNMLYMHDGQEFQFEFFNPRQNNVLAIIYINGEKISMNGLIIKPGQRVYLDRFLDVSKKFKFETYVIDDSPETRHAISKNGDIKIEFYEECYQQYTLTTTNNTPYYFDFNTQLINVQDSNKYSTQPGIRRLYSSTVNLSGDLNCNSLSCNSQPFLDVNCTDKKETGRVEKGCSSEQKLTNSNLLFQHSILNIVEYKILPISEHNKDESDIRIYCPNCKYRIRKQTWKYCPKCGEEL
jgi:ribosomal 50S subunit-recycling heat shock protein